MRGPIIARVRAGIVLIYMVCCEEESAVLMIGVVLSIPNDGTLLACGMNDSEDEVLFLSKRKRLWLIHISAERLDYVEKSRCSQRLQKSKIDTRRIREEYDTVRISNARTRDNH